MTYLKSASMLFTKQAQIGPWWGLSNIMHPCSSKGCKTAGGQSCRSGKNRLTNQGRLEKVGPGVKEDHFCFKPPTLIFSNSTVL